jgi:hypothetical protein
MTLVPHASIADLGAVPIYSTAAVVLVFATSGGH